MEQVGRRGCFKAISESELEELKELSLLAGAALVPLFCYTTFLRSEASYTLLIMPLGGAAATLPEVNIYSTSSYS